MKKVLLAFFVVLSVTALFGVKAFAADTGDLVIHFQKWDGDYSSVGLNSWGDDAVPGLKSPADITWETDDFGIKVTYSGLQAYEEGVTTGNIGTQFVLFDEVVTDDVISWSPNWNTGKLANVEIPKEKIEANKTTHVYLFEGGISRETSEENFAYPIYANNDSKGVMVVYYDSSNSYEENIGVHSFGWNEDFNSTGWNVPYQLFTKVGRTSDGTFVYAGILEYETMTADTGFLVYYGNGDDSKKTGDLKPGLLGNEAYIETPKNEGELDVFYVLNKGDNYTSNDNVWLNDPTAFAEEAFTFRFVVYNVEEQSGTYAVDPTTIITKISTLVNNPYPDAIDKDEAMATVRSWFTVREITGEDTYGEPLDIERVDFALNNATLDSFVVILSDELDGTKEYELFFNLNLPDETLEVAKDVEVTLNLTVPANTPTDAVISAAGSFNTPDAWTPGAVDFIATQVGDTMEYTLTFTVSVTDPYTAFEYKWTRGTWDDAEYIAANRPLVIPNNVDEITFDDVVLSWQDIDAPADKYAAPVRETGMNLEASIVLAMDTEAPELIFVSPANIVDTAEAQRIIEVPWGTPFNQNLFPRYRATDNRDGDLTSFVFVPKGENSVLDTRTEGDYTIVLRVVDKWGNATEEAFTFRVTKG